MRKDVCPLLMFVKKTNAEQTFFKLVFLQIKLRNARNKYTMGGR